MPRQGPLKIFRNELLESMQFNFYAKERLPCHFDARLQTRQALRFARHLRQSQSHNRRGALDVSARMEDHIEQAQLSRCRCLVLAYIHAASMRRATRKAPVRPLRTLEDIWHLLAVRILIGVLQSLGHPPRPLVLPPQCVVHDASFAHAPDDSAPHRRRSCLTRHLHEGDTQQSHASTLHCGRLRPVGLGA